MLNVTKKAQLIALLKRLGDTSFSEKTIIDDLLQEIEKVKQSIPETQNLSPFFADIQSLNSRYASLSQSFSALGDGLNETKKSLLKKISDEEFNRLSREILDLINQLKVDIEKIGVESRKPKGGGSMPLQVSANSTVANTRYADINFIGSGLTIAVTNNNVTKKTDLTFTATGGVTSVTAADTTLTITPTTGAVTAKINLATSSTWTGIPTFSNGVKTGFIFPVSNSTTAFQFRKADGTTAIMTVDSTNSRVGIGLTNPAYPLDVSASGAIPAHFLGKTVIGNGNVVPGLGGDAKLLITAASGSDAILTINRFDTSRFAGIDFITGSSLASGWRQSLRTAVSDVLLFSPLASNAVSTSLSLDPYTGVGVNTPVPAGAFDVNGITGTTGNDNFPSGDGGGIGSNIYIRGSTGGTGGNGSDDGSGDPADGGGGGNGGDVHIFAGLGGGGGAGFAGGVGGGVGTAGNLYLNERGGQLNFGASGAPGIFNFYNTSGLFTTVTASSSVSVNNTFTLPPDNGTSGYSLLTDGSGNTSWNLPTKLGIIATYNGITTNGAGVIPIYSAGDLTGQTAANNLIATYTPPSDQTFMVGAYLNVTAISVDIIQVQVTYTDETNTAQTQIFITTGGATTISATGPVVFPTFLIRAKSGTAITIKTVLTVGTGSITYDVGGFISYIR